MTLFNLGSVNSALGGVNSTLGSANRLVTSVGKLGDNISGLFGGNGFAGEGFGAGAQFNSAWASRLQQASFRGQSFYADDYDYEMDRRTVTHSFPFRDLPQVEDLGLGIQNLSLNSYLIGDDVYDQRDAFIKLAQTKGSGELVHPSLGSKTVTLISATFSENKNEGRQVSMQLRFIITSISGSNGDRLWQNITDSLPDTMGEKVSDLNAAMKNDFSLKSVTSSIKSGISEVQGVARQAQSFVGSVNSVVNDATRLVHAADGLGSILTGYVGSRFERKATGNALTSIGSTLGGANAAIGSVNKVMTGTNALISNANRTFNNVLKAGDSFTSLAGLL